MTHNQNDLTNFSRDAKLGSTLKTIGIILIIVGITWIFIVRFLEIDAFFLFLNWHIPVILLGVFLLFRGKQYIARSQPAEQLDDKRPPVVYLRPFKKDASSMSSVLPGMLNPILLISSLSSFEEQMAEVVQKIGPFVALANPGKSLPKPGASRFHAEDQDWQSLVKDLLNKARLVIIHPGGSEGVKWEIEQAFEILKPNQLLLLFHDYKKKSYKIIADSIEKSAGFSLPEISGRKSFIIAFSDNWKPRVLYLKVPFLQASNFKRWKRLINHALEPVFHDLNVEWRPNTISKEKVVAIGLIALVIVFILIILLTL